MQIEQQNTPETKFPTESVESKASNRGGKRPGAGRKPNLAKRLLKGFTPATIALAVQDMDVREVLMGLLRSKSERVRLETLAFLRDTLYGRPAQNLSLSGGVNLNMAVWRPLENLSDQEILLLDSITKKLNGPASNAHQDGPLNQIESKPALEAEIVESVGQGATERINLYPQGSRKDLAKSASNQVDGGARVRFVFESPSEDKSESARKDRKEPSQETIHRDSQQ